MSGERVVIHHLSGDGLRGRPIDTARLVNPDKFLPLEVRLLLQFCDFSREVCLLRICL
jgi:hypothetical protein